MSAWAAQKGCWLCGGEGLVECSTRHRGTTDVICPACLKVYMQSKLDAVVLERDEVTLEWLAVQQELVRVKENLK